MFFIIPFIFGAIIADRTLKGQVELLNVNLDDGSTLQQLRSLQLGVIVLDNEQRVFFVPWSRLSKIYATQ